MNLASMMCSERPRCVVNCSYRSWTCSGNACTASSNSLHKDSSSLSGLVCLSFAGCFEVPSFTTFSFVRGSSVVPGTSSVLTVHLLILLLADCSPAESLVASFPELSADFLSYSFIWIFKYFCHFFQISYAVTFLQSDEAVSGVCQLNWNLPVLYCYCNMWH